MAPLFGSAPWMFFAHALMDQELERGARQGVGAGPRRPQGGVAQRRGRQRRRNREAACLSQPHVFATESAGVAVGDRERLKACRRRSARREKPPATAPGRL